MDSGKAEGREAGPVADEESSVESGREVPVGGSGGHSGSPENRVAKVPPEARSSGEEPLGEADRKSSATCPRGMEESINRSAYRDSSRVRGS